MMYLLAHRQSNRVKGRAGYPPDACGQCDTMHGRVRLLFLALLGVCLFLLGGASKLQAQLSENDVYFTTNHVYGAKSDGVVLAPIHHDNIDYAGTVYYEVRDNQGNVTSHEFQFPIDLSDANIPITFDSNGSGILEYTVTITDVEPDPYTVGILSTLTITVLDASGSASVDGSFYGGAISNGIIRAIALQPDGRILVGGTFTNSYSYNNYLTRLTTDGSLDSGFNTGLGANGMVNGITLEPNGKILAAGNFSTFNTSNRAHVVRLDPYGAVDVTLGFNTNINAACYAALGLPDGKTIVGGAFWAPPKSGLVRLLLNGLPDISYDTGFGITNGIVYSMVPDGSHAIIGGSFTCVDVITRYRLARIDSFGQVDLNYAPPMIDGTIYAMAMQPDHKLIIAGSFTNILGQPYNRIARLNPDGSLDTTFASSIIPYGSIYALGLQAGGVYAAGSFTNVNGFVRNRLARFKSDGTLDQTFDPGTGPNHTIYALAVEPDGNVLIAGAFSRVGAMSTPPIVRLKGTPPTTVTTSFDPVSSTLTVTWPCASGYKYNLYVSEDLKTWTLLGPYNGSYTEHDTQSSTPRFYRVSCEP